MTTHFADTVTATRVGNGLVRLEFAILKSKENQEKPDAIPTFELILPIAGFGDLANICSKVAAELVSKGIFTKNEPETKIIDTKQ
jgi:hypothetical protein